MEAKNGYILIQVPCRWAAHIWEVFLKDFFNMLVYFFTTMHSVVSWSARVITLGHFSWLETAVDFSGGGSGILSYESRVLEKYIIMILSTSVIDGYGYPLSLVHSSVYWLFSQAKSQGYFFSLLEYLFHWSCNHSIRRDQTSTQICVGSFYGVF